jgi:uncharacterized flavoprotein (TIGR03862 family)
LLRAWLVRLRAAGVVFHMRHRWLGWDDANALRFAAPRGESLQQADAVVLALGGASWSRLGSDGAWAAPLAARGVDVAAWQPSNCGFDVAAWSEFFRTRFAGHPMKTVAVSVGAAFTRAGEFVITEGGVEGSLVYAASATLRDLIAAQGSAVMHIDLVPGRSLEFVQAEVARPRGSRSLSTHLKSRIGIDGVKAALLHELVPKEDMGDAARLASAIKALPLTLVAARPIDEAISSAGGVRFEALDGGMMLTALPGVFCAGEMLDWEAPTGGYLLTACLASGAAAARGVLARMA